MFYTYTSGKYHSFHPRYYLWLLHDSLESLKFKILFKFKFKILFNFILHDYSYKNLFYRILLCQSEVTR